MRSFFVQIFLSFWVSTAAIFVAATVIIPRKDFGYPENLWAALDTTLNQVVQQKVDAHDCGNQGDKTTFLVNSFGQGLCGQRTPGEVAVLAKRALTSNGKVSGRIGDSWAVAKPVSDWRARQYAVVLLTPFHRPPWFPYLPRPALPVSALVTFVFAYLLTKPVRRLRQAFRQFAGGDMSVRLPVPKRRFRTWGGADIRTLMVDFNEMADRIQALLEAHKILLRDVSHELRSPLARLNVALELAREEAREPIAALDRAEFESSQLNALIGELLSLSRMESIQEVSQSSTVSLASLVESLLPDLTFEAESRGGQVIHHANGDCIVRGNADILRRAIDNVIRNAIRYTPAGQAVEIESFSKEIDDEKLCVVRVCDRGPGVPEDNLKAIFRPFHKVDSSRQAAGGGFGVGLAIADRAVHLHRGTIQATNRSGGGLCVELQLPEAEVAG